MDDVEAHLCAVNQSRRVLHMAAHTELVFDRDDRVSPFTGKKSAILKQEIRVETLRQLFAFGLRLA